MDMDMDILFNHSHSRKSTRSSTTTINPLNLLLPSNDNHNASYLDQHNVTLTSPLQLIQRDEADDSYSHTASQDEIEEEGEDEIETDGDNQPKEEEVSLALKARRTRKKCRKVNHVKARTDGETEKVEKGKKNEEDEERGQDDGEGEVKGKKKRGKSKTGAYVASNLAPLPEDSVARYPLPVWSTVEPGQRIVHPPPYAFSGPTMAQSKKRAKAESSEEPKEDSGEVEEEDEYIGEDGDEKINEKEERPRIVIDTNIVAPTIYARPVQAETPPTPLTALTPPIYPIGHLQSIQYLQSVDQFSQSMPIYQPYIPNPYNQFHQSIQSTPFNQVTPLRAIDQINPRQIPDVSSTSIPSSLSGARRSTALNRRRSSLKPKGSKRKLVEEGRRFSVPNLPLRRKSHENIIASGQRSSYFLPIDSSKQHFDTPQFSSSSSTSLAVPHSTTSSSAINDHSFGIGAEPSIPYISTPYLYPPPLLSDVNSSYPSVQFPWQPSAVYQPFQAAQILETPFDPNQAYSTLIQPHQQPYLLTQQQVLATAYNPTLHESSESNRVTNRRKTPSKHSDSVSVSKNPLRAHDVPLWALNDPSQPIIRPYGTRKGDRKPWKAILDDDEMVQVWFARERERELERWADEDDEKMYHDEGDGEEVGKYMIEGTYGIGSMRSYSQTKYESNPGIPVNSLPPSLVVSAASSSTSSSLSPSQSLFEYNNQSIPSITVTHFDHPDSQQVGEGMGIGTMIGNVEGNSCTSSISGHQFWRKPTVMSRGDK